MSKGGGRLAQTSAGGRSKVTRAEYDDNVLRDNVRMDNKHIRSLKVHERAKNVVSRTIDKEAMMFKQKQSAQKTRLPGLNAQGQRQRGIKPDTTNWIPELSLTASKPEVTIQNNTLSTLVSSQSPVDRKSPLSPRDPFPQYGQLSSPRVTAGQRNGHVSPEVSQKFDTSEKFKTPNGVADQKVVIPQRRSMRIGSKESFDDPFDSNPRLKSASRKLYLDSKGILREQTVFDFLSKPKHNTELKKRLDTRIRLEKEFTPRRSISEKSSNKTPPLGLKTTGSFYKNQW